MWNSGWKVHPKFESKHGVGKREERGFASIKRRFGAEGRYFTVWIGSVPTDRRGTKAKASVRQAASRRWSP
jgi:hypothetical protein